MIFGLITTPIENKNMQIKTCPFCGSEPVVCKRTIFKIPEYCVCCDKPGCETLFAFVSTKNNPRLICRTESQAVDRWNQRVEPTMVEIKRRSY